jgi:hypothetical protein
MGAWEGFVGGLKQPIFASSQWLSDNKFDFFMDTERISPYITLSSSAEALVPNGT